MKHDNIYFLSYDSRLGMGDMATENKIFQIFVDLNHNFSVIAIQTYRLLETKTKSIILY